MIIHAATMGNYAGGIEINPDHSDCCPGCDGIKSRRAAQCRQCTNERIGRERVARGKVPGQMKRLLAEHRRRQNAEETIVAMGQRLEREVERAERSVKSCQ